jgi:hypothetical protein
MSRSTMWKLPLGAMVLALLAGCGGPEGPVRYHLTGAVTHNGKPVPVGFVTFIPDTKKGNKGPGGGTDIKDGTFDTASGKGMVGGPHLIQVVGFDGVAAIINGSKFEEGKPLFPQYEFEADLPAEAGTFDIEVPVVAAKKR